MNTKTESVSSPKRLARIAGLLYLIVGIFGGFAVAYVTPMGIFTGSPGEINFGALSTVYDLNGFIGYMIGGLLFGIATFRARILPRWAGGLLAIGAMLVPFAALLPPVHEAKVTVPGGVSTGVAGVFPLGGKSAANCGTHTCQRKLRFHPTGSQQGGSSLFLE